jgi:prepilin-type N-terminal cleavage/methylation domain-containing protein
VLRARRHSDPGFTLVEILIAIVLVGILSAVVVVGVGSLTSKGSAAACSASMDAARTGSVAWLTSNGSYPATLTAMTGAVPPALSLPSGVTIDASGKVASTSNWTLTMTAGTAGGPPTFACTVAGVGLGALPVSTGLIAWYDASDSASVTTSGSNVTKWADKSGLGNDAVASAGTVTYASAARNGLNTVRFNGSATLRAPHSASLNLTGSGLSVIVVYRSTAVNGNWAFINKENTWEVGEQGSGGGFTAAVNGGCWAWVGAVPAASGAWHTATFRYTPSWLFTVDSGSVTTAGAPCSGSIVPSSSGLTLGGRGDGASPTLTGDLAEVLIFDRGLTDTENDQVRAYLTAKWGTP